jgi:hypothetical protein
MLKVQTGFDMKKLAFLFILLSSCSNKKEESVIACKKTYDIVSSYGTVVETFDDENEATQKAKDLTYFGRVFPSKPFYFVLERN